MKRNVAHTVALIAALTSTAVAQQDALALNALLKNAGSAALCWFSVKWRAGVPC